MTLEEIAVMTRAAPAKLLGLKDRGQLGVGAAADVAVYHEQADREAMFRAPEFVFKDGVEVARAGRVTATPVGGTHFVLPDFDPIIENSLRRAWEEKGSTNFTHAAISRDELCRCCNNGRLLPQACFEDAGT
jgi:formylmethanofuran dehydrogenase subunit A